MDTSAVLLDRLFTALNRHDHQAMADCYHPDASFSDIAFDLQGQKRIHAMWHMICEGDIRATFSVISADQYRGQVSLVDDYTFPPTGHRVHNIINSEFVFRDGVIGQQHDFCDARLWATMAVGGIAGFFAGRLHFLRSYEARKLLQVFVAKHQEYQ